MGKHIREAISTGTLFRMRGGIRRSLDTLRWRLEAYDLEMKSIRLERAACEASVKELEEALKGELSTDEEEMARELAEEEVQRRLAACKSTSAAAGDVEEGVRGSLGPSSKAKGKRRANLKEKGRKVLGLCCFARVLLAWGALYGAKNHMAKARGATFVPF